MNTIEKIRAEIERRREANKRQYQSSAGGMSWQRMCGEEDCLVELLSFLDTLEEETSYDTQKYTPSPSVDIGDVARVQFASHAKVFDKKRKAVFDWEQFKEVVGIFYGFGKKDSLDFLEPVSEDLEKAADNHIRKVVDAAGHPGWDWETQDIADAFKAGAEWQKEQKPDAGCKIVPKWKGITLRDEAIIRVLIQRGDHLRRIIPQATVEDAIHFQGKLDGYEQAIDLLKDDIESISIELQEKEHHGQG